MRVGFECDADVGVPKHLLDYLGVDATGEQESGAGVPEVVVAYRRQTGPLQERLERSSDKVVAVDGCTYTVVKTIP